MKLPAKKISKLLSGCVLAFALTACTFVTAFAADGLDLSVTYPGISVKPGETLNIPVTISNTSGNACDAEISLEDLPENFDAYFQGGNFQINRIHLKNGQDADITLHVAVPKDLDSTDYAFSIKASSANGGADSADIHLNVNEANAGNGSFQADYPEQTGDSSTTFSFSTTLVNNGLTSQSYSFSQNAPSGWSVSFAPKGQTAKISSIDVEAGESQSVTVTVTPPENVAADTYTIPVSAVSAGETLSADLKVTISGTYSMQLHTPDERLSFDINSGSTKDVTLDVTNDGNVDLEDVTIASSLPTDWSVTYDLENGNTIDKIPAGSTTEVVAHVKAANDAITGDYAATFTASNDKVNSSAAFRASVKTSTVWGIAAVVIICAVICCLAAVIKKYGRR